uniref:Uncharacterized protein n=2 Tax=Natrinema zhouii TaxID=1710539 RepID=A0A7D6GQR0_9EURY
MIRNGAAFGKLAGRVTAVALALYVVSLVYQSNEELAAVALGSVVTLYAVMSLARDVQYGYSPWEPVRWTTVPPGELNAGERRRALRWTIVLKLLLVVGAVSGFAVVFAAGLKTLGYVLLIGGFPALIVKLYKHYLDETRPWHPSMPSRPDQLVSEQ